MCHPPITVRPCADYLILAEAHSCGEANTPGQNSATRDSELSRLVKPVQTDSRPYKFAQRIGRAPGFHLRGTEADSSDQVGRPPERGRDN
jgi:hypothetical protein